MMIIKAIIMLSVAINVNNNLLMPNDNLVAPTTRKFDNHDK